MSRGHPAGAVAAVDCGTNSTRLLVADADGRTLSRLMTITRLGQGVDRQGELSPEAVERTAVTLGRYRREMDRLGVVEGRQVATSAVRDAANGKEFMALASSVTGFETELLTGREEGLLSFLGATADLGPDVVARGGAAGGGAEVLVVDIGGGSTELVAGPALTASGVNDAFEALDEVEVVSVDLGCVRITERHLRHDPPTAAELDRAAGAVRAALEEALAALPRLRRRTGPPALLVGLAGTVSTIAALDQGLEHYDREAVHHHRLVYPVVRGWYERLAAEPAAARRRRPGMAEGRQDVILGGVLVLATLMERLGSAECLVSEADILDGLVRSMTSPERRPPGG